ARAVTGACGHLRGARESLRSPGPRRHRAHPRLRCGHRPHRPRRYGIDPRSRRRDAPLGKDWPVNLLDRASALFIGDPMAVPEFAAAPDLPPDVRFRAGRLVPWIGGVLARMSAPAAAVTLGRTIVVNPATA